MSGIIIDAEYTNEGTHKTLPQHIKHLINALKLKFRKLGLTARLIIRGGNSIVASICSPLTVFNVICLKVTTRVTLKLGLTIGIPLYIGYYFLVQFICTLLMSVFGLWGLIPIIYSFILVPVNARIGVRF